MTETIYYAMNTNTTVFILFSKMYLRLCPYDKSSLSIRRVKSTIDPDDLTGTLSIIGEGRFFT